MAVADDERWKRLKTTPLVEGTHGYWTVAVRIKEIALRQSCSTKSIL